jgi:putative DNA primase/helicase
MRVKVTELRAAYETWCRVEGETPVTAKALTLALRSRYGVISDRDKAARYYAGIRMTDVSSAPAPDPSSGPGGDLTTYEWWKR